MNQELLDEKITLKTNSNWVGCEHEFPSMAAIYATKFFFQERNPFTRAEMFVANSNARLHIEATEAHNLFNL